LTSQDADNTTTTTTTTTAAAATTTTVEKDFLKQKGNLKQQKHCINFQQSGLNKALLE
jgi:hypothetical protein